MSEDSTSSFIVMKSKLEVALQRVAELESERDAARVQLYSALQGAKMEQCPDTWPLSEVAERTSTAFLAASDAMGAHFEYDWELMAGPYGDGADAVPAGVEALINCTEELGRLVGWAQHHVPRDIPNVSEFLARALEVLGSDRAHAFNPDAIEPDQREEGGSDGT